MAKKSLESRVNKKIKQTVKALKGLQVKQVKQKFSVSVKCDGKKMGYFEGRDRLEKSLGESDGSGTLWGGGGWDCAWYGLPADKANTLATKARRFKFVKDVRIDEYK